jgi:hypothetical protein
MDRKGVIMTAPRFLRRKAASEYLHEAHGVERAPGTLAKLAVTGGGPAFRRVGRVPLYDPVDLDAWIKSKLSPRMRSTSEAAPEQAGGEDAIHQANSDRPTTRSGAE